MAKTNKEKLDKIYDERRSMALALGFSSASDMLTRLSRAYKAGGLVTVGYGPVLSTAIKPTAERTPPDTSRESHGPTAADVELYGTTLHPTDKSGRPVDL